MDCFLCRLHLKAGAVKYLQVYHCCFEIVMNKPLIPSSHNPHTDVSHDCRVALEIQNEHYRTHLMQQVIELRRLAGLARSPVIALMLERQAAALESSKDVRPALSPRERFERNRHVRPAVDDLLTAICKLGGINGHIETDWDERLNHLPAPRVGLPKIVRHDGSGRSLDDLAEVLCEFGYLKARDSAELEEKLFRVERGERLYSMNVSDSTLNRELESCRTHSESFDETEIVTDGSRTCTRRASDCDRQIDAKINDPGWRWVDGEWVYTQSPNDRESAAWFRKIPFPSYEQ